MPELQPLGHIMRYFLFAQRSSTYVSRGCSASDYQAPLTPNLLWAHHWQCPVGRSGYVVGILAVLVLFSMPVAHGVQLRNSQNSLLVMLIFSRKHYAHQCCAVLRRYNTVVLFICMALLCYCRHISVRWRWRFLLHCPTTTSSPSRQ